MASNDVLTRGIVSILGELVSLFGVIYQSGTMLFTWFSTPFESGDILDIFVGATPLQLMFGTLLPIVLTYLFIKFCMPF